MEAKEIRYIRVGRVSSSLACHELLLTNKAWSQSHSGDTLSPQPSVSPDIDITTTTTTVSLSRHRHHYYHNNRQSLQTSTSLLPQQPSVSPDIDTTTTTTTVSLSRHRHHYHHNNRQSLQTSTSLPPQQPSVSPDIDTTTTTTTVSLSRHLADVVITGAAASTMMPEMKPVVMAVFIVTMVLILAAEARVCEPECNDDERCVSLDVRRSHSNENVCVPVRCLTRGRRGRCRHSTPHFHFNRVTMSCEAQTVGACYSSGNSFVSHENCDLTCSPWYRR